MPAHSRYGLDPLAISQRITVYKFIIFEVLMFLLSLYGMYELLAKKLPFLAPTTPPVRQGAPIKERSNHQP